MSSFTRLIREKRCHAKLTNKNKVSLAEICFMNLSLKLVVGGFLGGASLSITLGLK